MKEELIRIENLWVEYHSGGAVAKALNGINLTINKGEALGLVGESGAGKTTTALSIMQLLPREVGRITQGDIFYHGESMLKKKDKEMNTIRGNKISMVFANPLTSLNPVFTVGHQIAMGLRKHQKLRKRHRRRQSFWKQWESRNTAWTIIRTSFPAV